MAKEVYEHGFYCYHPLESSILSVHKGSRKS